MNGKKIVDMMEIAFQAGREVPSIVVEKEGTRVKLYRQTSRSKAPGAISLNDGGPKGADVWYGSIALDGTFRPTRACPPSVKATVAEFAADPGAYAAAYGKGTSRCCFCATEITTDESKAVGYGPVCASNYGLPWGSKAPTHCANPICDTGEKPKAADGFCRELCREGAKPLSGDFDDPLSGDPGNDAEAALAAMEGAAGYATPEQEAAAHEVADFRFADMSAEDLAELVQSVDRKAAADIIHHLLKRIER